MARTSSTSPTRLARAYTWQPDIRIERTLIRRRLLFEGDARDLLRRAMALVAPLRPWRLELSCFPRHYRLRLHCGQDAQGVQTHVSVTLHPADVWLFAYFARDRSVHGVLLVELPDDDGEDLTIPHVSVDELAQMPATIGGVS